MKVKKNRIMVLRFLFAILVISNCLIIFFYSGQNANESTKVSTGTMYNIIKIINREDDLQKAKEYDNLIRKIAHFSIYTSLGVWSGCLMCTFFHDEDETKKDRKRILISILFGFLYACSDEIHQLFSDGRAGRVIDVIIDTLGVANGVLIVILLLKIWERYKLKKNNCDL